MINQIITENKMRLQKQELQKLLSRNEDRVTDPEQTGSVNSKSNSVGHKRRFVSTYFNRHVSRS